MPDRDTFGPVSKVLMRRCGSLDCHGSAYRNLRLVGFGGRRLDPDHLPDAPDTTEEELDANYESLIGLEPAVMRDVVQNKGTNAGKLTLLRKGRGTEGHKGGRRIGVGDEADLCLISWLHDDVNTDLCIRAGGKTPSP